MNNIGIDKTIDPKEITISSILKKIRRGRIRSVHTIGQGFGEVIEAEILESSKFANNNIKQIDLPKNVKVGAILRDSIVIIPNCETVFKIDDDVVFYSDTSSIKKLEELLAFQK